MENQIAIINNKTNGAYCSIVPKTVEEKKRLFNALENCDMKLNDIVGTTIAVKDVYVQEYPRTDKDTGEPISNGHRTILFDTDGKSYVTASNYFFVALAKVLNTFGTPDTWEEPLEIKIVKRPAQNGRESLSLELI